MLVWALVFLKGKAGEKAAAKRFEAQVIIRLDLERSESGTCPRNPARCETQNGILLLGIAQVWIAARFLACLVPAVEPGLSPRCDLLGLDRAQKLLRGAPTITTTHIDHTLHANGHTYSSSLLIHAKN